MKRLILRAALLALVACGARQADNPLVVSSATVPRPEVARRIAATPFNYFRFVNIEFSQRVCERFQPVLGSFPIVNLHGDAHLQQFAVTDYAAGLSDFDDSVAGPPVLDLVRFSVSIRLALEQRGWEASSDEAVARFLQRYRTTLSKPVPRPEPRIVRRMREKFTASHDEFLAWADKQMEPLLEPGRSEALASFERYVALMVKLQPERGVEFFRLKSWGGLGSQGIGSTRVPRVLARIEGPSLAPSDDVILEAKEIRDLTSVPCVQTYRGDGLRVIGGTSTFTQRADPFVAIIPRSAGESTTTPPWWIQSWTAKYGEVDVDEFRELEEVYEVIDAVGMQMALGHIRRLRPPYDKQVAAQSLAALEEHDTLLHEVVADMTDLTRDAYRRFRKSEARVANRAP